MLLIEQIQLFAVRERRIMIAINKYRNMKGEVSLYGFNRSESKRTFKTEEDKQLYEERIEKKISAEERLPGDMYNMQTTMENKNNMIARLEKELSTVQSKKTKATVGYKTTMVRCVLRNGFEIIETSACVDAQNYDQKLGEEICMKKIKDKIWYLLGFLLQTAWHGIK